MSAPTVSADVPSASLETRETRLRLWPGVLLVGALWGVRMIATLGEPSPLKFFVSLLITPIAVFLLLIVWWLLFSRLKWADRGLVLGALAIASASTWLV